MVISPKIKKSMLDYSIKSIDVRLFYYILSILISIQNVKYLGLNIDDKLNFKRHIKIVERKIACAVGLLAKSKRYLPRDVLLRLYPALFECHLIYVIPVRGCSFQTYFDKLITGTYHNKAVKTIAK